MSKAGRFFRRYRVTILAVVVSVSIHAAMFVSLPRQLSRDEVESGPSYTATLDPAAPTVTTDVPAPAPKARPRPRRAPSHAAKSRIAPPSPPLAQIPPGLDPVEAPKLAELAPAPEFPVEPAAESPVHPLEKLALAQPATPVKALEPPTFPAEAFPASVSIDYQLTSAFADGRASYQWTREGDSYVITAEAAAEGFFTLFLEGRILQESRGTITKSGLKPATFTESKPGGPAEGLEFDWLARQVTFDRHGEKKTAPMTENAVDWLSMIFQLAHAPPKGESFEMQVFTQRKLYSFHLKVLGEELIEIPLGRVRALHLNHTDAANPREVVDVWLGVDQHYLPVKLRFPAARNRLVVEQVATRVSMSEVPAR